MALVGKLNITEAEDIMTKTVYDPNENSKIAYAETEGVQALLVSGANIKTVNSNSLLGAGDIVIEGGGGLTQQQIEGLL